MTTARWGHGVVLVGDRMIAVGGELTGGTKDAGLEVYDFQTGTWETGPFTALATARSHFGCAVLEGRVHVVGGEDGGGAGLSSVERYDPARNTWTSLAPLAAGVEGALCLRERGRLTLFGGEVFIGGSARITDRILYYESESDRWVQAQATLPYPARDLCGVAARLTWSHRSTNQTEEFCLLGGGWDGTIWRDGFFRFYTR